MLLLTLLSITTLTAGALLYQNRKLTKERDTLLSEMSEDPKVLFLKSRYASMGETVGNIAHQWKQPLNAIGTIQNSIKAALIFQGEISKEKLLNSVETSFKLLQHLAETIDTFYSFLAQSGDERSSFSVSDELEKVRKITEYSFENSNITLKFEIEANPTIQGNANEFTHAMLNLILNAKDAFDTASVKEPIIIVRVIGGEEYCTISVSDNAGGIRLTPVDMVFDMHITTKEEGSGLGLYMTKNIIEKRFGGKISVKNITNGASFSIELPYAEYGEYFTDMVTPEERLTLERINQLSHKIIELEEVEKTLKKWSDIFKKAHWAIALHIGTENRFEITNDTFSTYYGYTSEEMQKLSVSDLFTSESLPILPIIQKEAFEKGYVAFESIHKRRDGSTFPVSVEILVVKDDEGVILYHIANIWDISDKKASEERLQLKKFALDHIQDAVFLVDENAHFHYANAGACKALGYTSQEFERLNVGDVDPDWPSERWNEHWEALKKAGSLTMELRHRRKDGTIFPVEVSANYIEFGDKHYNMAIARDITERKAAQKELLLVDKALNNTNEAAYILIDARIVQVNDGACRMLGYSREEFSSMTLYDIDKDATFEDIKSIIDSAIETNNTVRFERKHTTKEGQIINVEIDASLFEYDSITYSFCTVRDITEQKKAREELLLKEFALNRINEAVYLIDEESMFHYVNDEACTALGYTKEELLTMGVIHIDPDATPEWWRDHWVALKQQKHFLAQTTHRRKDGTVFPIEVSINYFEYNGIGYNLAVVRDITERLQLEAQKDNERMRLFFERQLVGMAITSPEKGWIHTNEKLQQMLGYTHDELSGLTWADVTYPDDLAEDVKQFERLLHSEINDYMMEKRYIRKNGTIIYTNLAVSCVRNEDSSVNYVLALLEDITARKQMEMSLKEANDRYIQILDNSIDVIYLIEVTPEGHFVYVDVNAAYEEVTGIPRDVVIGLDVEEIEDETFRTILTDKFNTCLNAGEKTDYTADYPFPIGVRTFHSILLPIRDDSGRIVRIVGSARDITERQEMEEALKKALEFNEGIIGAIPDLLFEIAPDGTYVGVWAQDEILLVSQRAALIGKKFQDVLPPEVADISYKTMREVDERGYSLGNTYSLNLPEGIRWFELSVTKKKISGNYITLSRDITKRKELEEQLLEQNQFLDSLLNAIPVPVFYKDKETRYRGFNKAFEEFYGKKKEDMIGKGVYDLFPPEQAQVFFDADADLFRQGGIQIYEHKLRDNRGVDHDVIFHKAVYFDNTGSAIGQIGTILDITERKKIEEKLQANQAQLSSIISTIPDMLWVKDINGIYLQCNTAYERFLGVSADEIIGKTDYDFGSKEQADFFTQKDREALNAGTLCINEEEILENNGNHAFLETHKVPVYNDQTLVGILGIGRDITERKAVEETLQSNRNLLHAILESSPDVITFALDRHYRYIAFDSKHAHVMGTIFGKEIAIGMDIFDVISSGEDSDIAKRSFDRALAGENFIAEEEYGDERLSRHYWQIYYAPIRTENDEIIGLTCFNTDITERREKEEIIKNLNTSLEQKVHERTLELQQSLEFSEGVINALPDLLFEIDANGTYLNVWARDEELLAAQKERLLGHTLHEILSKESADTVMMGLREADLKGTSFGHIIKIDLPQGTRYFEESVSRKSSTDTFLVLSHDITESRQTEQSLRESEETFRAIVENSPDVISRYDLQMRRTYVNPMMQFLLGKPYEEILGKTPREFSALPDIDQFEQAFDAVVQGKSELELEGPYLAPWGEMRWGNQRLVPEFDTDHNVISVMVIGRDMSERIETEKRLKMIEMAVNSSAEAVYINKKDLSIIYVNDEACRMLGYSRDELLSMKILEIDAKYTLEEVDEIIKTKINEGKIVFETQHRKKDGSVIDVEIAGSFFKHEDDEILISLVQEISPA